MKALDRIEVAGFKSIRHLDLKLRPLNVLIGANGAGKSNFISLFKLLSQIAQRQLQVFVGRAGGTDALLHFGQKNTNELLMRLHFGGIGYEARLIPAAGDILIFADEVLYLNDIPASSLSSSNPILSLVPGQKETQLYNHSVIVGNLAGVGAIDLAALTRLALESFKVYHFHDTSESAKLKHLGDINDNATLRTDASNLAAFLYLLREKHQQHYDRILKTIQLAAPFLDDFTLRPSPLNPNKIKLEWREQDSDAYFDAVALSDGTLRFICLTTLLLQPNPPAIILIDEPELGLHPYAINLLADLLRRVATQVQVMVSTQSVPLVNQFSPEDIVVVDREKGQSVFKRLESKEIESWLEDYSLGELWEKNVIGGRPSR